MWRRSHLFPRISHTHTHTNTQEELSLPRKSQPHQFPILSLPPTTPCANGAHNNSKSSRLPLATHGVKCVVYRLHPLPPVTRDRWQQKCEINRSFLSIFLLPPPFPPPPPPLFFSLFRQMRRWSQGAGSTVLVAFFAGFCNPPPQPPSTFFSPIACLL